MLPMFPNFLSTHCKQQKKRFDGSQRVLKICGYYGLRTPPYKLVSDFMGYMHTSSPFACPYR